jgi:hypothetical protein
MIRRNFLKLGAILPIGVFGGLAAQGKIQPKPYRHCSVMLWGDKLDDEAKVVFVDGDNKVFYMKYRYLMYQRWDILARGMELVDPRDVPMLLSIANKKGFINQQAIDFVISRLKKNKETQ